jgi:hypothetical protein
VDGVDITINDDDIINFGDSAEVTMQYDEDGLNGLQITGPMFGYRRLIENVTAADTLTTAESGTLYVVEGIATPADLVLTLPSVGAGDDGIWFQICDVNETAAADVSIARSDSDTVNGSANAFSSDGADELPCCCTVVYDHSNTDWVVVSVDELGDGTAAWDSE